MTAPDLAARAATSERDLRNEAQDWDHPAASGNVMRDAADLIRDLRAEIERQRAALIVLDKRHEELRGAFDAYADHGLDDRGVNCKKTMLAQVTVAGVGCTCGLDDARKKWGGT